MASHPGARSSSGEGVIGVRWNPTVVFASDRKGYPVRAAATRPILRHAGEVMPVSPEPQVDTSSAIVLAGYLGRRGVERAEFLQEAELRPGDVEPDARISRSANQRLWEVAIRCRDDPAFGVHRAAYAQPGAMRLAEYVARTAKDLLGAGEQFARLARMTHDAVSFEVEEVGDQVHFHHRMVDGQRQPLEVVDFLAGRIAAIERQLAGEPDGIRAVHLPRPRPGDPRPWQRFFRTSLVFGAGNIRLDVDGEIAHAPLRRADLRPTACFAARPRPHWPHFPRSTPSRATRRRAGSADDGGRACGRGGATPRHPQAQPAPSPCGLGNVASTTARQRPEATGVGTRDARRPDPARDRHRSRLHVAGRLSSRLPALSGRIPGGMAPEPG